MVTVVPRLIQEEAGTARSGACVSRRLGARRKIVQPPDRRIPLLAKAVNEIDCGPGLRFFERDGVDRLQERRER